MKPITPFLWFNNEAEEAAKLYTSLFPNSRIRNLSRYPEGSPGPVGQVMTVTFELNGQTFTALNGGPHFKFTEAVSFVIDCEDQEEVDKYWNALTADGGQESQCGWLKDKFGLSWQVTPKVLGELLSGSNPEGSKRAMAAMLKMKKIDISKLEEAYNQK
jgi:predicted 3-demethylubiquinone-9 3-methyltransferase (glyoxalase superfamily)